MPHPLIIIGLNGASFDVLDPLMARGELPHLERLCTQGWRTQLSSSVPTAPLPAWTSFLTGAHPGQHGVAHVVEHVGYETQPVTGALRERPTFLAQLSERGAQVAALGVPGTSPPEPINGIVIAGADAAATRNGQRANVWPHELYDELVNLGGWRYPDFGDYLGSPVKVRRALHTLLEDIAVKERVILHLYLRRRWDVFFVHLGAAGDVARHLWHAFDAQSPRHPGPEFSDALPAVYRRLDALIGRLLYAAPNQTRVMVLSDHGTGGAGNLAVYLNRWLAERGHLGFESGARRQMVRWLGRGLRSAWSNVPPVAARAARRYLSSETAAQMAHWTRTSGIDLAMTRAFSDEIDAAPSIWIHREGAFPRGSVPAAEANALAATLAHELSQLTGPSGEPIIARVHAREDLYQGPFVERAPDLVLEPAWPRGYRPSFLPSPGPGLAVEPLPATDSDVLQSAPPGVARRDGMLVVAGTGIERVTVPRISLAEAGSLVYALADFPVPGDATVPLPDWVRDLIDNASSIETALARPNTDPSSIPTD